MSEKENPAKKASVELREKYCFGCDDDQLEIQSRKENCPNCGAYRYCHCARDNDTILHVCKKCGAINP